MDIGTACAVYFKRRPAYHRILEAMRKKYQGLGRVGGQICISDATQTECDAARELFGRTFSIPLKLSLSDFENALQQTPYRGVSLPVLLASYFDETIRTKAESRRQKNAAYESAFAKVGEDRSSKICRRWLVALEKNETSGTGLVRQALSTGTAALVLRQVCESVEYLEAHAGQPIRLAILSARITSDPHALDTTTAAGKLLLHLLAFRVGTQAPGTAEERDNLYFEGGILCDSISSNVTQTGLVLMTGSAEHPAYRELRTRREICTLTLTNLATLTGAYSPSGRAYLVENEMVFSQLCDDAATFHSPLICTSGQVEVAVLRLLDMLVASGTTLFYAGDFDVGGLNIAARLARRYPNHLRLWHMTEDDYIACVSEVPVDRSRIFSLGNYVDENLVSVALALKERGHAGYQELLISRLHQDLTSTP